MKTKRIINTFLMAITFFAIILPCSITQARYPYTGMTEAECIVTNSLWDMNGDKLSLPTALSYANGRRGDASTKACQDIIHLRPSGGKIHIMRPMEITTGSGLSIIGETADGTTEAEVEFDAIYFDFEFHPETIPECLIIVNGSDATLKNIKITNLPVGMHGICVKQSNDVLDAVKITSLNNDTARNPIITNNSEAESSGVVFFEGSTDSVLKSNSEIKGMDGYAVEFRRETSVYGSLSDSIIEAAGILVDDVLTQFVPTDENMFTTSAGETSGLVDLVTAEVSNKVVLKANSVDKLIKNDSSIAIVIKNIIQSDFDGSSSYWFVEGRVINSSVSYENSTICDDYTNNDTTKRIQIYTKDGFYNYVGAVGQDGTSGLYDQGDDAGYFNFYIPTSVGDQIALIPEGAGGKLGRPTPAIPMQSHDSDTGYSATAGFCPDVDNSGNHTGGGDGGGGGGAGGGGNVSEGLNWYGFSSQSECDLAKHGGDQRPVKRNYDTDGDGIHDDDEDINRNCVCDPGESCYDLTDTDGDGISDGVNNEIMCKDENGKQAPCCYTRDDHNNVTTPATCSGSGVLEGVNRSTADLDNDGIAQALDDDSDNDGRFDYQEDRNLYYDKILVSVTNPAADDKSGILYQFRAGMNSIRPIIIDGEFVPCSLGTRRAQGVAYDWWITTHADNNEDSMVIRPPVSSNWGSSTNPEVDADLPTTSSIRKEMLMCRHRALAAPSNFNGKWDHSNQETNFIDVDTDDDGWCDGTNQSGCTASDAPNPGSPAGTMHRTPADNCPTVSDTTNNCPFLPCSPSVLLFGTQFEYLNMDGEDPSELKRTQEGHILAFVQADKIDENTWRTRKDEAGNVIYRSKDEIQSICFGDLDEDGIPNCVESPKSLCDIADPQTKLRADTPDTDDDGKNEGYLAGANEDVCPSTRETSTDQDKFDPTKPLSSYSCGDPRQVYNTGEDNKAVALFLDRDNDKLRDGEEDKNLNSFPDTVEGIDGIALTESDPLDQDTDDDEFTDYQEVSGTIKTNPADKDTDDDGLTDFEEDRDGSLGFSVSTSRQGSNGCPNAMAHDTNPLAWDTDEDGLSDGTEVEADEGSLIGQSFIDALLNNPDVFSGGGIDVYSDPTIKDSDFDGIDDGVEYSGVILYFSDGKYNSHPCMKDSDGDSVNDKDDGCPLNNMYSRPEQCAIGGGGSGGADNDLDGLPNRQEQMLGTDPDNPDTDGDGLWDGVEDKNKNGIYEPTAGETDPKDADSDDDNLSDGFEVLYGTLPTNFDTDGDCIPDGLEDANHDGYFAEGSETNALQRDTDTDGLPDGSVGGVGEDLNCNGTRDIDERGRWLETDPRIADSDHDGNSDYNEMFSGGYFNLNNVGRANSGRESCSLIESSEGNASSMIFIMIGFVALLGLRTIPSRIKKE